MKKILYLRTDISNEELVAGGSVTHTRGIIKGFIQLGHQVVCASSTMCGVLQNIAGITELVSLYNPKIFSFLRWRINCILSNVFFTFRAYRLLKTHTCTLIYQRYSVLNATGLLLSKWTGVPLYLEYNGSEVWITNTWVKKKKKLFQWQWLMQKIEDANVHGAARVIVVSDVLKKELVERGVPKHRIKVVPNGVDLEEFNPDVLAPVREHMRKELNIQDKCVFGFVGTFSYWHGIEIIAQMIPHFVGTNAHFLLIGDGVLMPMIKDVLSKYNIGTQTVTLTGTVAQEKAREYLAACDAFLCPTQGNKDGTEFFGSPTKLFEYMALQKPILASDLSGIRCFLSPDFLGKGYYLVSEQDIVAWVHEGIKLMSKYDLRVFVFDTPQDWKHSSRESIE